MCQFHTNIDCLYAVNTLFQINIGQMAVVCDILRSNAIPDKSPNVGDMPFQGLNIQIKNIGT
jgi:hypothetical protein